MSEKLKVLDIFSGIGGISIGLDNTGGFKTVAFCEIEKFPQKVLAKKWPNVPIYKDVRNVTGKRLLTDGITVDVITGGFPCQDISCAGKQAGLGEGTRSGLWSEIARLISDLQPKYAIVENVTALLSGPTEEPGGWFGRVLGDLAEIGYDAEWHCIPASALGAHHHRDRIWIIAYPSGHRSQSNNPVLRHNVQILSKRSSNDVAKHFDESWLKGLGNHTGYRELDGVPNRSHRLKGLGNAVYPEIPELIGNAILEAEMQKAEPGMCGETWLETGSPFKE